jgi:hypothetical protein
MSIEPNNLIAEVTDSGVDFSPAGRITVGES